MANPSFGSQAKPALLGASSTQPVDLRKKVLPISAKVPQPLVDVAEGLAAAAVEAPTTDAIVMKWADDLGRSLPPAHQRAHWELVVEALPDLIAALDAR